jgi:hypothetical protein
MLVSELLNFIVTKNPIYVNGDLKIIFLDNCPNENLINVKHYGWICPSIYEDNIPPENGYGNFCVNSNNKLIIDFESFEYLQIIYLSIEFISLDIIRIRYDRSGHSGTLLKLL